MKHLHVVMVQQLEKLGTGEGEGRFRVMRLVTCGPLGRVHT